MTLRTIRKTTLAATLSLAFATGLSGCIQLPDLSPEPEVEPVPVPAPIVGPVSVGPVQAAPPAPAAPAAAAAAPAAPAAPSTPYKPPTGFWPEPDDGGGPGSWN